MEDRDAIEAVEEDLGMGWTVGRADRGGRKDYFEDRRLEEEQKSAMVRRLLQGSKQ
jgi:hypothetical protein